MDDSYHSGEHASSVAQKEFSCFSVLCLHLAHWENVYFTELVTSQDARKLFTLNLAVLYLIEVFEEIILIVKLDLQCVSTNAFASTIFYQLEFYSCHPWIVVA